MVAVSRCVVRWGISRAVGVEADKGDENAEGEAEQACLEDGVPLQVLDRVGVVVRQGEEFEDLEEDRQPRADDEQKSARPVYITIVCFRGSGRCRRVSATARSFVATSQAPTRTPGLSQCCVRTLVVEAGQETQEQRSKNRETNADDIVDRLPLLDASRDPPRAPEVPLRGHRGDEEDAREDREDDEPSGVLSSYIRDEYE